MKRKLSGAASLVAVSLAMSMPAGASAQSGDASGGTPCDRPLMDCVRDLLVCAPPGCVPPSALLYRVCDAVFGTCRPD